MRKKKGEYLMDAMEVLTDTSHYAVRVGKVFFWYCVPDGIVLTTDHKNASKYTDKVDANKFMEHLRTKYGVDAQVVLIHTEVNVTANNEGGE